MKLWLIILFCALATVASGQSDTVLITEFVADNETGLSDEDGDNSDWVELFNAGTNVVDLFGWYLTDNRANLVRWQFPATILPPEGFLVVFASGKDRTLSRPLHTNFKLDADREYLGLIRADGLTIASEFAPFFPPQTNDVSYGRFMSGPLVLTNPPTYLAGPSPGMPNAFELAPPVHFSRPEGTFVAPFDLTLFTDSTNAVIHYVLVTTNSALGTGTTTVTNVPTTNSPIYTGPIRINQTTQVRARAFEPGKLPGTPISVTYIQISPNVVNFSSDLPLIIVHNFGGGAVSGTSIDRTAILASFHADLDRSSLTNQPDLMTRIGVNDIGGSTAGQPKPNMAVEFWDEFNHDIDHPLLGMPADSDWVLYAINGFDPGMMHNAIFHWFGRQTSRYSSRTRYVEVFLKTGAGPITTNDYWGVYLLQEKPTRSDDRVDIASLQPEDTNPASVTGGYLLRIDRIEVDERTFTVPTRLITNLFVNGAPVTYAYGGQSVIVDYPDSLQWATDPRRAAQRFYIADYFTNFLRALTAPNFTDPELGYARYIDVDSWVDYHIANVICYNVDGIRLSGYFFKDRDKKIEQGPVWDCNRCLGTGGAGGATPQGDGRCFNPRQWRIPVTGFPGNNPDQGTDFFGRSNVGVNWWDQMFRDPDFWQKYIDRYQQLRTDQFSNGRVLAMVDDFHAELKEAQVREQARWSATFTYPRNGDHSQNGYSYNFGPANPQFARGGYFTNEVNFQKKWLLDRLDFMDTNFLDMPMLNVGSSVVTNGTTITVQADDKPGTVIYYTLDGTDPRLRGGGISSTALSSSGELTLAISNNVRLFARCHNTNHFNVTNRYVSATSYEVGKPHLNSYWSGPVAASFYTTIPPLVLTELMYHPAELPGGTFDREDFEFVELMNAGSTVLNLAGCRFVAGITFTFSNLVLAAGERVLVVKNRRAFESRYGAGRLIAGEFGGNLSNDGERLALHGPLDEPVFDFTYQNTWHRLTDGAGQSLVLINEGQSRADYGTPGVWRVSSTPGGSPGRAEAPLPAIKINEVLNNAGAPFEDAIELYNPTSTEVEVSGWWLTDDFDTPRKFQIPDGTFIPAGGFLAFDEHAFNWDVGADSFSFKRDGDEAYLFAGDASGNLLGYVHGFEFGAADPNVTFGRYVNTIGQEHFVAQAGYTMSEPNAGPQVGPVVISEIMYHPPPIVNGRFIIDNTADEYLELHNITDQPVPLYYTNFTATNAWLAANTWRLDKGVNFSFPTGVVLPPHGFVLVVSFDPQRDPSALARFREKSGAPPDVPLFGPHNQILSNSGELLELYKPGEPAGGEVPYILVDKVNYQDGYPWPEALPDGRGAALGRIDSSAYGDDPANWRAAPKTPGAPLPISDTPPTIVIQPINTSGVEGRSATITLSATGSALGYIWTFNGQVMSAPSAPTLTLTGLSLSQAGTYACIVFNSAGAVLSSNVTLFVCQVLSVTQHPTSRAVYIKPDPKAASLPDGTNVTFTIAVTSLEPPVLYQWRFNGVNIPGATNDSLLITNVSFADEGDYACAVADRIFTVVSDAARLTPLITPQITTRPLDQRVITGATFSVSAGVSGHPLPFGFQWRRGGTPLASNTVSGFTDFWTYTAPTNLVTNLLFRVVVKNPAHSNPGVTAAFYLTTVLDSDVDGLSDEYELAQGLSETNASDAALDADGDGMSNRDEYIAGTDPTNHLSYLKIDRLNTSGTARIEFLAVSNRTYAVEASGELPGGPWTRVAGVVASATNRLVEVLDPTPATGSVQRVYRLVTPRGP